MDIESSWTESYAGQIPNSGHELAIYDYSKIMLAQLHTKSIFHDFFVSCISYRPTDLSLLKEFSKNVSFSNRASVQQTERADCNYLKN